MRDSRGILLGRTGAPVSCSIGVSYYLEHGTDFTTLFAKADRAMYQAKKLGRGHYCIYGNEESPVRRLSFEEPLQSYSSGIYRARLPRRPHLPVPENRRFPDTASVEDPRLRSWFKARGAKAAFLFCLGDPGKLITIIGMEDCSPPGDTGGDAVFSSYGQ